MNEETVVQCRVFFGAIKAVEAVNADAVTADLEDSKLTSRMK